MRFWQRPEGLVRLIDYGEETRGLGLAPTTRKGQLGEQEGLIPSQDFDGFVVVTSPYTNH